MTLFAFSEDHSGLETGKNRKEIKPEMLETN